MELHCPRCLSKDIRRSRQGTFLATILRQFWLHPYRCRSCRKRFFRAGEFETRWDAVEYVPIVAKFPRGSSSIRHAAPRVPPRARAEARPSAAVRMRDWNALLERARA